MSRSVETYIRFSDIFTGSLLENEQDEEPVVMRDGGQFPDEGLTHDERNVFYDLKTQMEACTQPKCMSSQTQFSAEAQVRWNQPTLLKLGTRKQTMS